MEDTVREDRTLPAAFDGADLRTLPLSCGCGNVLRFYPLRLAQPLHLALIKVGAPLGASLVEQAADIVRICINIWGKQHGAVAIHELLRAILQDEPLKIAVWRRSFM